MLNERFVWPSSIFPMVCMTNLLIASQAELELAKFLFDHQDKPL